MDEKQIIERLDVLAELKYQRDSLETDKKNAIEKIIPADIREQLDDLEEEFADKFEELDKTIEEFEGAVKAMVKDFGSSVKAELIHAVYSKPRVTWDTKGLDGFMVAHPEIGAFRKVGEPSISIRMIRL